MRESFFFNPCNSHHTFPQTLTPAKTKESTYLPPTCGGDILLGNNTLKRNSELRARPRLCSNNRASCICAQMSGTRDRSWKAQQSSQSHVIVSNSLATTSDTRLAGGRALFRLRLTRGLSAQQRYIHAGMYTPDIPAAQQRYMHNMPAEGLSSADCTDKHFFCNIVAIDISSTPTTAPLGYSSTTTAPHASPSMLAIDMTGCGTRRSKSSWAEVSYLL